MFELYNCCSRVLDHNVRVISSFLMCTLYLHDPPDVVEGALPLLGGVGLTDDDGDEVRDDGENVDYVHHALQEGALLRGAWI